MASATKFPAVLLLSASSCSAKSRSTPVTSSRPVDDWGKLLGDTAAVAAALNRLLHHEHVLKCGPRTWRTKVQTDLRTEEAQSRTPLVSAPTLVAAGFETVNQWSVWSRPPRSPFGSYPRETQTLQRIGELAAEGKSEARICIILNEDQRATRTGKAWAAGTVHGISVRWQQTADARLQPRPPPVRSKHMVSSAYFASHLASF